MQALAQSTARTAVAQQRRAFAGANVSAARPIVGRSVTRAVQQQQRVVCAAAGARGAERMGSRLAREHSIAIAICHHLLLSISCWLLLLPPPMQLTTPIN